MMYKLLLFLFNKKNLSLMQRNRSKLILLFIGLFLFSTSGFLFFELPKKPDLTWADAIWWTFVTMTTVGYGDLFPETIGGRFMIGIPTMIFGIGFLGVIISEIAAKLIDFQSQRNQGMIQLKHKDHVIIINFYRLEQIITIIQEIRADRKTAHKNICLIDESLDQIPQELLNMDVDFVRGNPTEKRILQRANLEQASHVIVLSKDPNNEHSDDLNLAITIMVENLHPDVFSIVEIINPQKIHQVKIVGADSVVCVSQLTSNLIIQELQDPGVQNIVAQLTSNQFGQQLYIVDYSGENQTTIKELVQWGMDNSYTILGKKDAQGTKLNCNFDEIVLPGEKIILLGQQRPDKIKLG